jgi:DNA-binding transcriptional MerR regulator
MRMSSAAAETSEKSAEAFRTISEVSLELDVPQHVLRFWESRFTQVRPIKRAGGRRYYRPEDVDLLRGIRALLYTDGMTIRGAQKVLRDKGPRYVSEIGRGEASLHGKRQPKEKFHRQLRAVDFSEEPLPEKIPEPEKKLQIVSDAPRAPTESTLDEAPTQTPHAEARARLETLLTDLLQLKTRLSEARAA